MKYFFLLWMLFLNDVYVKLNIDYQENFLYDYKYLDNLNNLKNLREMFDIFGN